MAFGSVSPKTTLALITFNSTVWTERCNFFISTGSQDYLDVEQSAGHLARAAALALMGCTSSKPKGFGKAGQRTDAQAAAARDFVNHKLSLIPPGDAIAFTDGASRGNPGPAGAGATLYVQDSLTPSLDFFAPWASTLTTGPSFGPSGRSLTWSPSSQPLAAPIIFTSSRTVPIP